MNISARSCLAAGVAVATATAIAFAPSEKEPARATPTVRGFPAAVQLIAQVQPTVGATAVSPADFLALIVQHYVVPPSASRPFPTPQFPPVVGGTSIGSSIKNIYNAVEPWVEWGVDVAAYAVGWVPYVGWLAPQIEIFYNFGERIVRSITFNIADWLDGTISFGQGLLNVGVDTVNAFIQLGIDQWNFWLWPLPPLPPIFPLAVEPETEELTIALSNEESLESLSLKASKEEGEVIDEFEGARAESLGEELTQGEELIEGEELTPEEPGEEIDDVLTIEETDVDLRVNALTDSDQIKDELTTPTTTDTSGTVQAQGKIRESTIATPTEASPQAHDTNGSPAGDPNEEPTASAQALSPQEPSTNDDDPPSSADAKTGDDNADAE